MHGLVIGVEPIEMILDGSKTWEIRGKRTAIRGTIALIKKGTKTVVGLADIVAVHGPLTLAEQRKHWRKHRPTADEYRRGQSYKRTYAWELANVHKLPHPVPYQHPSGAVTWVRLAENLL